MNSEEFLRQVSAQAKADNPVPRTKLGYIDDNFDLSTYPQVLPKVKMDGQPLSERGYSCLSSYFPVAGDRVILLPHGISYLILGAVDKPCPRVLPGTHVFTAFRSASQSFSSSGVGAMIQWDDIELDLLGSWSSGNNTRFSPPLEGFYHITGGVGWNGNSTGNRGNRWVLNGTDVPGSRHRQPSLTTSDNFGITARPVTVHLSGGDYIEFQVDQTSGGTLSTTSDNVHKPRMDAFYLGNTPVLGNYSDV